MSNIEQSDERIEDRRKKMHTKIKQIIKKTYMWPKDWHTDEISSTYGCIVNIMQHGQTVHIRCFVVTVVLFDIKGRYIIN